MSNKRKTASGEQTSWADIVKMSMSFEDNMTLKELDAMIKRMLEKKEQVKRRKNEEKLRKEREEQERKAREEQRKLDEHVQEVTCMDLPLDWENVYNCDERTQGVHVDSVADALVMSLSTLGKVDIEFMSAICGLEYKEVISALRGSIYQNPQTWNECFYNGWETADESLSGNLMRKWQVAKEANDKYKGHFADNLRALQAVLPPTVATKDIYVTLGSPWVPTDIIDDFIVHLYKRKLREWEMNSAFYAVRHDEITGTWEIPFKTRYNHSVTDTKTYGTDRIEALHIMERTLNMKSIVVTDEVTSHTNSSGKKRVVNKEETLLATEC